MKGIYKKFQSGNSTFYIDADRIESVEYIVRSEGENEAFIYLQGRRCPCHFLNDDADAVRDWAEKVGKVPPHLSGQSLPLWHDYQGDIVSATDPAPGWED